MSKNSKTVVDGTKPGNRNNINIQINFNVKDKNQGFSGKKIDNYVEIDHKNNSKADSYSRQTDESKKIKKKIGDGKNQKNFDTPLKHRQIELNKVVKYNQKTPEKKDGTRKQERSKSTNRKLVKRKNVKSVENLRAGAIKYTRNKGYSPNSSGQKSRSKSHSKSSKKIGKSNEPSAKNLYVFSNSGIKNKAGQKHNQSRSRLTSATTNKKPFKEEDSEKIKKYMEEKKRKEKMQSQKKARDNKSKKEKRELELKKVEAERKANASKPIHINKKSLEQKKQRLPIYCSEDEEEFQQEVYDRHNQQASSLLHESPPRDNIMESISMAKFKKMEQNSHHSSSKKSIKKKKGGLVYRYLNGPITDKQMETLQQSMIKIQKCWRGYMVRCEFASKLNDESTKYRYIKNKIENKKGVFWNNDEDNSIVNIEKDSSIKVYDSGSQSLNFGQFHSNPQSQKDHHISDEKSKTDKFKKLEINLSDSGQNFHNSKERSQKQTYENSKMLKEIEELRKKLDQQNQQYKSLEEENENLKANIKLISLKESRQLKRSNKSDDMINSSDFIEIRMPKKIQSPPNEIKIDECDEDSNKHKPTSLALEDVEKYKKHFQAFDCSSPSNARIEEQLKQLRHKNVENIFAKKSVKRGQVYQKKSSLLEKLLSERIVSPRTYNIKKKQLDEKVRFQEQEMKQKIEEAKRVIGYFDDLSSEEGESEKKVEPIEPKKSVEIEESESLKISDIEKQQFNFKKNKKLVDEGVNTSPIQIKKITFNPSQEVEKKEEEDKNDSYSSEDDRIYKKYWTDDIEEVHKHTVEITKRIEEALKAESEESSSKKQQYPRQYSSGESSLQVGYHSYDGNKEVKEIQNAQGHSKSKSQENGTNPNTLKDAYQDYMEQIKELPSTSQQKARQIFNKIQPFDDIDCKSDEQMENSSHENICKLLNERPLSAGSKPEKKPENLYISEAEFNQKKRKEEELQRSSSFQKSNKSLSVNNSSLIDVKGFITNLTFIKEFCISICQFIRNSQTWKQSFISKITNSSKYNLSQLLRSYRVTVGGQVNNKYNTFNDEYIYPYFKTISQKNPTISHELFTQFMKVFEQQKITNLALNEPVMNKRTKQMRQFFLVCIIDTFNEALEYEKPGSVYGQALPWLNSQKHLKNHQIISLKNASIEKRYSSNSSSEDQSEQERRLDQVFGTSIAKLIQWGSCLCGFIADPMPMEMGDSQIANLSDEQLSSIRENRVGLMLQKWLLEQQEEMTNSNPYYTQVVLGLTEKIYEELMLQCNEEVSELMGAQ